MKRNQILILCLLSSLVLILAVNVSADTAFTHIDYSTTAAPTIDGQYVGGTEWSSSGSEIFGTNGIWRDQWMMAGTSSANEYMLIETSDATNDAGDYWELCFDGNADGGAAPQADDYKVRITGHGATATVQWYKGTGTAWATTTAPATASFTSVESLSTSPKITAAHYILEIAINKGATDLPLSIYWGLRVAYNDAATGGSGLQAWPPAPATADSPTSWGYIDYQMNANPNPDPDVVPESLSIALVLVLSSVAIISGTVLLRKHPKTINLTHLP